MSYTKEDFNLSGLEENEMILEKKHNLVEILDDILVECDNEADRSFVKELFVLLDLNSRIGNHKNKYHRSESRKRFHTDEWKELNDSVQEDVVGGLDLSCGSGPMTARGISENKTDPISSSNTTEEASLTDQTDNNSSSDRREENVNSNMGGLLTRQEASRVMEQVLRGQKWLCSSMTGRHTTSAANTVSPSSSSSSSSSSSTESLSSRHVMKWKCRSAPELRRAVEREESLRSLSQHDMPFWPHSYRCDGRKALHINVKEEVEAFTSLLWGEEAYRHYKLLTLIELKEKLQQIQTAKRSIIKSYKCKQGALNNIVKVAKAYYRNPNKENREKWKKLRHSIGQSPNHSITDLQHQLAKIPDRLPYFTIFLMMAHVLSLVIMIAVSGLAPTGVLSEKKVARGIQTFLGEETVHRYIIPNPWIGPPVSSLLGSGASFGPCLRNERNVQKEGQRREFKTLDDTSFACCEMRGSINAAGTTTAKECKNYTNNAGMWRPPLCSKRGPGHNSVAHVIRPCCVDHRGTCQMMSQQHCAFLGGTFHEYQDHCVQVLCIRDICMLGKNHTVVSADPLMPWLPHVGTVWQWWRPLLGALYTLGVLHCAALLALEWLLMWPMESSTGCLTVMLIYIWSAMAGQIVACTAQPYVPQVGSSSGLAGMIGVAAVELSQAWTLLDRPWREVVKLGSFSLLLLLLGFLPFLSLLGTLAGCVCGAICALISMPYLTLDKDEASVDPGDITPTWIWNHHKKAMLMVGAIVVLLVYLSILLYTFVTVQPPPCQACRSLECLSLSQDMCNQWDLLG